MGTFFTSACSLYSLGTPIGFRSHGTCTSMGFGNERRSICAFVSAQLRKFDLPYHHLVSVTSQLSPGHLSVYEAKMDGSFLNLEHMVRSVLDGSSLHGWLTWPVIRPVHWLEDLRTECRRDSHLDAALTAYGLICFRLPSRDSWLFFNCLAICLEVLLREGPAIARVLLYHCDRPLGALCWTTAFARSAASSC